MRMQIACAPCAQRAAEDRIGLGDASRHDRKRDVIDCAGNRS